MTDFANKVAIVTGAAGGIGAATCRQLIAAGATVGAIDVATQRLETLARDLGSACVPVTCDITDANACAAAVQSVRSKLGRIDVLVNNAGVSHHSRFDETDPAVIERVMAVNFYGSVNMTRAALPDIKAQRGVIVVVSSVAGFAPLLERAAYSASKHALHGMFETLAAELRPAGVHVAMVCPSFVRTDIDSRSLTGRGSIGVTSKRIAGRLSEPADVATHILVAITARRRRLIPSTVGKLSLALSALAPGLYERLMVRSVTTRGA